MSQDRSVAGLTLIQRGTVVLAGVAGFALVLALALAMPETGVRWLKTMPIVGLALAALASRPRTPTTLLSTGALVLAATGDALFVGFIPVPGGQARIAGIATFSIAYLLLIAAFWRGPPARREWRFVLPLAVTGLLICILLWGNLSSLMRVIVPVFAGIIVTMAWTTLATRTRGRFAFAVARLIAPVGVLLVVSDLLVALHMFHPAFTPAPVASEIVLRLTFLAGWTLVLLTVQLPQGRAIGSETPPASKQDDAAGTAVEPNPLAGFE